jgi:hypothetical protein
VVWQAGRLSSVALGGVLADWLGVEMVWLAAGVLLLGAGVLGFTLVPTTMMRPKDPSSGLSLGGAIP